MRWLKMSALLLVLACGSSDGNGTSPGADAKDTGRWVLPTDLSCSCTPEQKICDGNTVMLCDATGNNWAFSEACTEGTVCANGACVNCQVDQLLCQGNTVIQCKAMGNAVVVETCTCDQICTAGACVICTPGERECREGQSGDGEVWICVGIGPSEAEWQLQQTCTGDLDCINGLCLNPCASDIKLNTNQGCDYYAVDLENSDEPGINGTLSAADAQFAVLVTNPSETKPLGVEISETQKGEPVVSDVVPPKGQKVIKLNARNIPGTVQGEYAWRVKGNHPFVAYQFNPLDNVNPVFSNDASLLLPVNALGTDYMIMTGSGGGAFVTVVGTKSETDVTVTVTAPTTAGDGIPALANGEQFTTTLAAAEVLNIRAADSAVTQYTLTGTTVTANKDVVVFGGNVATISSTVCCADHLEQQMFPTKSWGKKFVCGKSQKRMAENDYWRILALEDGTTLTFSGGLNETQTLNGGKYIEIPTAKDFLIESDKPVLVGQILASSFEVNPAESVCSSNSDCASGVCSGGDGGIGTCIETCTGSQAQCAGNETCIDNTFVGDNAQANGGSCFRQQCGASIGQCPFGSTCVPNDTDPNTGQCYETCTGLGAACANPNNECYGPTNWGNLCLPKECLADWQCSGGGWCSSSGVCVGGCTPQPCADGKSACLPAGFSANPDIKVGICIAPDCNSDADCGAGHTCTKTAEASSCEPIGDPAFILTVPVEQFRDEYTFLTPTAYKEDYINVIAPTTAFVQLDGADIPVSSFTSIPGTNYMVARLPSSDGAHSLKASQPVGLVVYGYHDDVSYGYPGGANLFDLGN